MRSRFYAERSRCSTPLTTTPAARLTWVRLRLVSKTSVCDNALMESRIGLHDFLNARYAELNRYAAQLRAKLQQVEIELEAVKTAANAIGVSFVEPQVLHKEAHEPVENEVSSSPAMDLTMKQAALKILEQASDGLTASEILEVMSNKFGMLYPRSSLSPQLSRLKHDGLVDRKDGKWHLTKPQPDISGAGHTNVFE